MRTATTLWLALALWLPASAPALADGRVALVIGNSEYGAEIGRLKNPANDARLIAETLQGLGFTVDLVLDADQKAMKRAMQSFGAKLREAGDDGIGLFYYAGHGLQVQGENYLVPVGANIETEADVDIEAVPASGVLRQMERAGNAVNLVFLDACRNNPLTRSFRSAERGLARVEGPTGSFIGYSTAPNSVAADGDGANSPYALALAREIGKPGQSILAAHLAVRGQVMKATAKQQVPWDTNSLTGDVVLAALTPEAQVGAAGAASATPQASPQNQQAEMLFWESIKDSDDAALFESYLKRYPDGTFVEIAHARLQKLNAGSQQAAVSPAVPSGGTEIAVEDLDATYVARQSANVRGEPTTDAPIVGRLAADDAVAVTGKVKDRDWLRVAIDGQAGYVSSKLLAAVDAQEIADWQILKEAPDEDAINAFLAAHPSGYFKSKAELLLASFAAPAEPASPVETVTPAALANRTIRFGIANEPYPPFESKNASGVWVGWEIEYMDAVCRQAQLECEIVEVAWDGIIPGLQEKQFDVIWSSMTITDDRKEVIDFTNAYYDSPIVLVGRKSVDTGFDPNDPSSAANIRIGVQTSTVYADALATHYPAAQLEYFSTQDEVRAAMVARSFHLYASDAVWEEEFLSGSDGAEFEIKAELPDDASPGEGVGGGLRKGDTQLKAVLNAAIHALNQNGTCAQLARKYFKTNICRG